MESNQVSIDDVARKSRFPTDQTKSLHTELKLTFTQKLDAQQESLKAEFGKLKAGQNRTREFNVLIKSINQATVKGELHCKDNADLLAKLAAASKAVPGTTVPNQQEPDLQGIELNPSKTDYDKDELDRLLDNIRRSIDDLNVINEMQLQNLNRMVTHYHEIYQMMKNTMKPLHEDKIAKARAIAGGR